LRVVDAKLDYFKMEEKSSQKINIEIAHGLDSFGANASVVTRVGNYVFVAPVDPEFTRYDMTFTQTNIWAYKIGSVFSVTGQYSPNTLPTTEQISFGGARYGLAYDPGTIAGDKGWGSSLEFNRPYDLSNKWVRQITPYVITQFARSYLNAGTPLPNKLGTAGLGVRWTDKHYYAFDLTLAQPIGDKPLGARHRSPRINLAFSYQFK
jgi:hemolysin activation/secretion protein